MNDTGPDLPVVKNPEADEMPADSVATSPTKLAADPREDRDFISALARGLEVLTCFGSGDKLLGPTEIAQMCKLPKSTVARLIHTLVQLGYLSYVPESGKYRLGTATLALGAAMLARLDVRQIARPLPEGEGAAEGKAAAVGHLEVRPPNVEAEVDHRAAPRRA